MTAHFSLSYDGTKPSSPGAVIGQLIGLPNRTTSVTQLDVMCPCYVSWLKEDWRWNGIVQARLKMHSMRRKMKHNFQEAFSSRFAFYHNFLTCYLHSRWLFLCTSRESLIKRFFSRRLLLLLCFSFWVGTRSFYFSSSFFLCKDALQKLQFAAYTLLIERKFLEHWNVVSGWRKLLRVA